MQPRKLSQGMLKRVKKELARNNSEAQIVDYTYVYIPVKLYPSLQKRAVASGNDPALVLTMHEYPFKAPKVYYCSKDINEIYRCGGPKIISDEIGKMLEGLSCLGCRSILCGANWSAMRTIDEIVKEFHEFTSVKARAVERVVCNRIQEQLFLKVSPAKTLPVEDYKISDFL